MICSEQKTQLGDRLWVAHLFPGGFRNLEHEVAPAYLVLGVHIVLNLDNMVRRCWASIGKRRGTAGRRARACSESVEVASGLMVGKS